MEPLVSRKNVIKSSIYSVATLAFCIVFEVWGKISEASIGGAILGLVIWFSIFFGIYANIFQFLDYQAQKIKAKKEAEERKKEIRKLFEKYN